MFRLRSKFASSPRRVGSDERIVQVLSRNPVLTVFFLLILALVIYSLFFSDMVPKPVLAENVLHQAKVVLSEETPLHGILHQRIEALGSTMEIWYDFDRPGRYRRLQFGTDGQIQSALVQDGIGRRWLYQPFHTSQPTVFVVALSPEDLARDRLAWESFLLQAPQDVETFLQHLEGVEYLGTEPVGNRQTHLIRYKLDIPQRTGSSGREMEKAIITLGIDTETAWLLRRSEIKKQDGQDVELFSWRTSLFELLSPQDIPDDLFMFVPPEGVRMIHKDSVQDPLVAPEDLTTLDTLIAEAPFVPLIPAFLPEGMEFWYVRYAYPPNRTVYQLAYRDPVGGNWMYLYEGPGTISISSGVEVVKIRNQDAYLWTDPISARSFTIYLNDAYLAPASVKKPYPRGIQLHVFGVSREEAIRVLESLGPVRQ